MLCDQRIAVVVPARNEQAHIERVIGSIPDYVDQIVLVDDASQDATATRAVATRDRRLALVRHTRQTGAGGAIVSGYRVAFADGASVAAVIAGDGQMDPGDLPRILEPVLAGRADYTKGNRLNHPEVRVRMPATRLWGNRLLSWLTRRAVGLPLDDSQCGYTALSQHAFLAVPWHRLWRGYGYPNDLLGWLALAQLRVRDVMVAPLYANEQSGVGLRHALVVIPALLARVALRRMRGHLGRGVAKRPTSATKQSAEPVKL